VGFIVSLEPRLKAGAVRGRCRRCIPARSQSLCFLIYDRKKSNHSDLNGTADLLQLTFGLLIEALLLRDRHKFFKLPLRFPSMLLYLLMVDGGDCLVELDVRLRNVKIPLLRLSAGDARPLSTLR
jgi:hypothetical protein